MVTDSEILEFFREHLDTQGTFTGKLIYVQPDDILQEYADESNLLEAIEAFSERYNVDITKMNWEEYFPWERPFFIKAWITGKYTCDNKDKTPLKINMFAESARSGHWLYK